MYAQQGCAQRDTAPLNIRVLCYIYGLYVTYTGSMLHIRALCYIYGPMLYYIYGLYVTYTGAAYVNVIYTGCM